MLRPAVTLGGITLVSRVFGFFRDVMMAAFLGAGPVADAFMMAFRLPNHFRAIFAEGAFNAAFIPTYTALEDDDEERARLFANRILTILTLSQIAILLLVWSATSKFVSLLAPGFDAADGRRPLTVELLHITFPYLLLITIVTFVSGILNAHRRFAAAAAAPVFLNICMILALIAADSFPSVGHALAWGVLGSGVVQLGFVLFALRGIAVRVRFAAVRFSGEVRLFFRRFWPAVLGSAGVQIALFADTIIASLLSAGAVSHLYYADRLYQLPLAVVGIAIGTVLLPELSRLVARGEHSQMMERQSRALSTGLALTLPFVIAFLLAPVPIVSILFERGAFGSEAVTGTASVLQAYAIGLPAFVALRAVVVNFHAFGDTATPVKVMLLTTLFNVGLKLLIVGQLGVVGLAIGTSAASWLNLVLLIWLQRRAGRFRLGDVARAEIASAAIAAVFMVALALLLPLRWFVFPLWSIPVAHLSSAAILALSLIGYAIVFILLRRIAGTWGRAR